MIVSNINGFSPVDWYSKPFERRRATFYVLRDYINDKSPDDYFRYLQEAGVAKVCSQFLVEELQGLVFCLLLKYTEDLKPEYGDLLLQVAPFYCDALDQATGNVFKIFTSSVIVEWRNNHPQAARPYLLKRAKDFVTELKGMTTCSETEKLRFRSALKNFLYKEAPLATSLALWREATQKDAPSAYTMYRQLRASAAVDKSVLLEYYCDLEKTPYVAALITARELGLLTLLNKANGDIFSDEAAAFICSSIFNRTQQLFSRYSSQEQKGALEFLRFSWQGTQKTKYLELLIYCIPFALEMAKELELAIYLTEQPLEWNTPFFQDALTNWITTCGPKPKNIADVVHFFALVLSRGHKVAELEQELLRDCSPQLDASHKFLPTYFILQGEEYTNLPLSQQFQKLLQQNLVVAAGLTQHLESTQFEELLDAIQSHPDDETARLALVRCAEEIISSPETGKLITLFAARKLLTVALFEESKVTENVAVLSLCSLCVSSCPESERKAVLSHFVYTKNANILTAWMFLQDIDREEIRLLLNSVLQDEDTFNRFIDLCQTPIIKQLHYNLLDAVMVILLESRSSNDLHLAAAIQNYLPLSGLKALVQKAEKILRRLLAKEQAATSDEEVASCLEESTHLGHAIAALFKSQWHNDFVRTENRPEWFKKHNISHIPSGFYKSTRRAAFRPTWYDHQELSLYTTEDTEFELLTNRLETLTLTRTPAIAKLTDVIRFDKQRRESNRKKGKSLLTSTLEKAHKNAQHV